MSDLKEKIVAVTGQPCLGALASLTEDGKPWVRFVVPTSDKDLNFRFATHFQSRKIEQMRKNPNVHLVLGRNTVDDMGHPWLQVVGKAEIHTEETERRGYWRDEMKAYFSGPDDPNYCVVIIRPSRIEYMSPPGLQPEVWQV
jgi:general stress protein 26